MATRLFVFILACALSLSASSNALASEMPSDIDRPLFSASGKKFTTIDLFYKWTDVLSRFGEQPVPAVWQRNDVMLQALPAEKMAEKVNSIINSYAYISDKKKEQSQTWETPLDFFARGGGSCQDFAIAKYLWLEHLGIEENALRLAVVYDRKRQMPHAISLVYAGRDILVLDNQNRRVKDSRSVTRYTPIYSLNRQAWWKYTGQGILVDPVGNVSVEVSSPQRNTLAASGR